MRELTGRLVRLGWITPGPLEAEVARMQHHGATAVLMEHDSHVIGTIAARDELSPEAAAVVTHLHDAGYAVAMLTGDNATTARALAAEAEITTVHADLRPEGQSLGLSLAIITVLLPLALFGVLGLAAVVLVHELAEVFVIANGIRAARTQKRRNRVGRPGYAPAEQREEPGRAPSLGTRPTPTGG